MSLAGHKTGDEPLLLIIVSKAFLYSSLAYPLFYVPCLVAAISASKKGEKMNESRFAWSPLIYLGVIVGLFFAWSSLEKN